MTLILDARTQKALELAATAAYTWARLGSGAFRVPSQGNPGQEYVCSPTMCECPDSRRNPERLCKHSIAASVIQALIETQPEPARTGLVATREDDDCTGRTADPKEGERMTKYYDQETEPDWVETLEPDVVASLLPPE